jgi:hypothetical protein
MIAHEGHPYISNSLIAQVVNFKILWKDITKKAIVLPRVKFSGFRAEYAITSKTHLPLRYHIKRDYSHLDYSPVAVKIICFMGTEKGQNL